jgi:hypothetical protein
VFQIPLTKLHTWAPKTGWSATAFKVPDNRFGGFHETEEEATAAARRCLGPETEVEVVSDTKVISRAWKPGPAARKANLPKVSDHPRWKQATCPTCGERAKVAYDPTLARDPEIPADLRVDVVHDHEADPVEWAIVFFRRRKGQRIPELVQAVRRLYEAQKKAS